MTVRHPLHLVSPLVGSAAAVAIAASGLGAAAAPAAPAPSAAPTASSPTTRADIDGDGRADLTTFRLLSRSKNVYRFELRTTTARGATTVLPIRLSDEGADVTAADVFRGAAGVDGARGSEVVLDLATVGDFPDVRVLRWDKGRFVSTTAPGRTGTGSTTWPVANHGMLIDGYTFSTRKGVRYVVAHHLPALKYDGPYRGTHTTYRWSKDRWQQISRVASGTLSTKAAERYNGLSGLVWR